MSTTLRRPTDPTPHDLDFLEGIDLSREARRRAQLRNRWIVAAIAILVVLAAVVVAVLMSGDGATVSDQAPDSAISGRDLAPALRPHETDLLVLDTAGLEAAGASAARDLEPAARPAETDLIVLDTAGLEAGQSTADAPSLRPLETDRLLPQ
jgi:hypothetical protein